MSKIHVHCDPIDCPKCQGGKMVPCILSDVYKKRDAIQDDRGEDCVSAEYSYKPYTSWKCTNCGHEIIPGQDLPEVRRGLTKTGKKSQ